MHNGLLRCLEAHVFTPERSRRKRVVPRVVVATGRLEAVRCHNHAPVTRSCSGYALLLSLIAWRKLMRGPVRRMEFE